MNVSDQTGEAVLAALGAAILLFTRSSPACACRTLVITVNKLRGVVYIDNVLLRGAKYARGCLQLLATMSGLAMPAENSLNSRRL